MLRFRMDLKNKAQLTYDKLCEMRDGVEAVPAGEQSTYLTDILTDLADAARRQGCTVELPNDPSCVQALNVVTSVLDWVRAEAEDDGF